MTERKDNKSEILLIVFLIAGVSLFHYSTQMRLIYYHLFYRELYFLPIILAGVWFGLKGSLATSVSVTVLYLPMIALNWRGFSPDDFDRILETLLFNIVAMVLGLLSDKQRAYDAAKTEAEHKAREQAESATRLKSDFLSITSHELRTPLISIIGYNDLLLDGVAGTLNEEQINALRKIDRNSKKLLELINTMLEVSRLDAKSMEIKSVNIPQFIEEVKSENRGLIESSGLGFTWKIDPNLDVIQTDPEKLKVVLKNLIGNAVKFTERGSVAIGAYKKDTGVEFCVSDTGIGIAQQDIPIIFDSFRQLESSLTREHGGVGLGLFIVKRLLDILGGTISVESEVGKGAAFYVRIPIHGSIKT